VRSWDERETFVLGLLAASLLLPGGGSRTVSDYAFSDISADSGDAPNGAAGIYRYIRPQPEPGKVHQSP